MRIRTGHKPDEWTKNEPTLRSEPANLDDVLKLDLSPSWKQQNEIRWETKRKAKAA